MFLAILKALRTRPGSPRLSRVQLSVECLEPRQVLSCDSFPIPISCFPEFPTNPFLPTPKPVKLEIVKASNSNTYFADTHSPVADSVRIGLWDQAYEGAVAVGPGDPGFGKIGTVRDNGIDNHNHIDENNFIGLDSQRFYFRLTDPNWRTDTQIVGTTYTPIPPTPGAPGTERVYRHINWWTTYPNGSEFDGNKFPSSPSTAPSDLTLYQLAPDSDVFVSHAVMLVTTDIDWKQSTKTGFKAGDGSGVPEDAAAGQSGHRTRRAELDSLVKATYSAFIINPVLGDFPVVLENAPPPITISASVTAPVFLPKEIATVNYAMVVAEGAGIPPVDEDLIKRFEKGAQDLWTQAGLKLIPSETKRVKLIDGVLVSNSKIPAPGYQGPALDYYSAAAHTRLHLNLHLYTPDNQLTVVIAPIRGGNADGIAPINSDDLKDGLLGERGLIVLDPTTNPIRNPLAHELFHVLYNRGDGKAFPQDFTFNANTGLDDNGEPVEAVGAGRRITTNVRRTTIEGDNTGYSPDSPIINPLNWQGKLNGVGAHGRWATRYRQENVREASPSDSHLNTNTGNRFTLDQAAVWTLQKVFKNPPTSKVQPFTATSAAPTLTVAWTGQDGDGGPYIDTYDVYVSTDGGPFTPFLQGTWDTSATFNGSWGHTYSFYSIATDFAGNVELTKSVPDATITLPPPLAIQGIVVNGGATQRSNLEQVSIRFNQDVNLAALIAAGTIGNAFQFYGTGGAVAIAASRFHYNSSSFTLTLDLTVDGFGGSQATWLNDGKYQVRLNTSLVTAGAFSGNALQDDDGLADGFRRVGFHRLLGDFDGDGLVNGKDQTLFLKHYGSKSGQLNYDFAFDLNGDGAIGLADYSLFKKQLGKSV